jgi:hypothetical protein
MRGVLKDNKVIQALAKNKFEATIDYMVAKMDLILTAPEEILLKEGDSLESNRRITFFLTLKSIENNNMYFIAFGTCIVEQ